MGTPKRCPTGAGRLAVGPRALLGAVLVLGAAPSARAIVNGTLDETNEGVGFYRSGASSCSGVLVHTEGTVGWVLTSSLCDGGPLGVFLLGTDWTSPDWSFMVTERHVHPGAVTNPRPEIYDGFIVPVTEGLPLPLFADGFESGGTTAWSATVP